MNKESATMHGLGCFIHGILVFGHTIGFLYNYKRKNFWQAGVHVAVAGYDVWAVDHHLKMLKEQL